MSVTFVGVLVVLSFVLIDYELIKRFSRLHERLDEIEKRLKGS